MWCAGPIKLELWNIDRTTSPKVLLLLGVKVVLVKQTDLVFSFSYQYHMDMIKQSLKLSF